MRLRISILSNRFLSKYKSDAVPEFTNISIFRQTATIGRRKGGKNLQLSGKRPRPEGAAASLSSRPEAAAASLSLNFKTVSEKFQNSFLFLRKFTESRNNDGKDNHPRLRLPGHTAYRTQAQGAERILRNLSLQQNSRVRRKRKRSHPVRQPFFGKG